VPFVGGAGPGQGPWLFRDPGGTVAVGRGAVLPHEKRPRSLVLTFGPRNAPYLTRAPRFVRR